MNRLMLALGRLASRRRSVLMMGALNASASATVSATASAR
jgi:hypothetical protein